LKDSDIKLEFTKGKGPGGQNKNKLETAVRATHIPTGITVFIDGRKRGQNIKKAKQELKRRVDAVKKERRAAAKKSRRDAKIKERNVIRTYDYSRNEVIDHRTGKRAPLKRVLRKGRLD